MLLLLYLLSLLYEMVHFLCEEYFHNVFDIIFIFLGDILVWWLVDVWDAEVVAETVYVVC